MRQKDACVKWERTMNKSKLRKEERTMKTLLQRAAVIIGILLLTAVWTWPVMAATNQAIDQGTGGITLTNSGTVTVTSSSLALVKAIFNTSGTCLASSDSDAACNTTSSVSVPTGTELVFVIYVSNATGIAANDIRFQDNIDDVTADYFEFQANKFAASQGIMWATRAATGATKANIWTALSTGTALTNAFDGSTGANEYCGINTGVSPDQMICGGDTVSPNNDQVNVSSDQVFAVKFHVIKRD